MLNWIGRTLVVTASAGLLLSVGAAAPAQAEKKSKVIQTQAVWVEFNPEAKTIAVKVKKPGKKPKDKSLKLKKGKDATFNVKPEGSVLTRTTVKINGLGGKLTDIPVGKSVNVYWIPDPKNEGKRFARSIDVIFSEEELKEKWKETE